MGIGILTRLDRDGKRAWSRVIGTDNEDEPYGIRAAHGEVAVVGRSRRFPGFDNTAWDAFFSISATSGNLVGSRAIPVDASSILLAVAARQDGSWVVGGSDGWSQNPEGLSIGNGNKLLMELASVDATPVRRTLPKGPRHNEIRTVSVDGTRIRYGGHEDGPSMHTGDADHSLISATGVIGTPQAGSARNPGDDSGRFVLRSRARAVQQKSHPAHFVGEAILLFALAVDCSGSSEIATVQPTDGSAPTDVAPVSTMPTTYEEYRRAYAHVLCEAIFECAPGDEWTSPALFGTVAECEKQMMKPPESTSGLDLLARVASGSLVFRPDEAAKCLAALEGCVNTSGPAIAGCLEVLEGSVPDGGPCSRDEECAGDAYCGSASGACPGACRPRSPAGGPCLSSYACAPGDGAALCQRTSDPMQTTVACRTFAMRHGAAVGEACGFTGTEAVDCARGLRCDRTGHCATPVPEGGSCAGGERCGRNLVCNGGQCVMVSVASVVGAACPAPVTRCNPLSGLFCSNGTCQASDGTDGAECPQSGPGCRSGFFCDRSTTPAQCTAAKGAGSACFGGDECQSGSCAGDGKCAPEFCAAQRAP